MQQALQRSSLVPSGFVVESAYFEGDKAVIAVRASGSVGLCPSCGTVSRRVHSRYRRRVTDLPLSGRIVQLLVIARRFRCDAVLCGRQIFTERFAEGVLTPSARRTARLDSIVHHLGLALGGRPAAGFAKRLMLPVSKDTLLRVVRRRSRPPSDPLIGSATSASNRTASALAEERTLSDRSSMSEKCQQRKSLHRNGNTQERSWNGGGVLARAFVLAVE
jgi:transposase